jgi:hypothetical protein
MHKFVIILHAIAKGNVEIVENGIDLGGGHN